MATTEPVLQIHGTRPPRATSAYQVEVAGTSSPAERHIVWNFVDTATAYLDYVVSLHGYGGGGLTLRLYHMPVSGTPGNAVRVSAAIRRIADDAEDLDTTVHTYDYNASTMTTASAAGELAYDTITFTD